MSGLARQLKRNQDATESLFESLGDDKSILQNFHHQMEHALDDLAENIKSSLQDTSQTLRAVIHMQNQQIQRLEEDHDEQVRGAAKRLVELADLTHGITQELKADIKESLASQHVGRQELQNALGVGLAGIGNKLIEQQQQRSERELKTHEQLSSALGQVSARQIELLEKSQLAMDEISAALTARLSNPSDVPPQPTDLAAQYQDLRRARREMARGPEPRGWRNFIHPFQWMKNRRYRKLYGFGTQAPNDSPPPPQPAQNETAMPVPGAKAAPKANSGD